MLMGIPVYFGTKLYGWVYNDDGSADATQFFHIYYIPLFPVGSHTVTQYDPATETYRSTPRGLSWKSILYTYVKAWGFLFAIGLSFWAFDAIMRPKDTVSALLPPMLAMTVMWGVFASWFWLGRKRGEIPTTARKISIPLVFIMPTLILGALFQGRFHDRDHRSYRYGAAGSGGSEADVAKTLGALAAAMEGNKKAEELAGQKTRCTGGDLTACLNLGVKYLNGDGVAKDGTFAATLFDKACTGGKALACTNLGIVAANGQGGMAKDPARAVAAYIKGCELGAGDACNNLGVMFRKGEGVPVDLARAIALYDEACTKQNKLACNNLGAMYAQGLGVKKSASKAAAYRKRAAVIR